MRRIELLNKPLVASELDSTLEKYLATKKTKQEILFDIIDLDKIADVLSLPKGKIILKLLLSFNDSIQTLIAKIESQGLDDDTVSLITGLSKDFIKNLR